MCEASGDEPADRRGEAAAGGGCDEADEADEHHAAAAQRVAESAAGDEDQPEGESVAGDDPLQRGGRPTEVRIDRGECDIDDRDVEEPHERDAQCDREDSPAVWVGTDVAHGNRLGGSGTSGDAAASEEK